jgi:hypothetical protein
MSYRGLKVQHPVYGEVDMEDPQKFHERKLIEHHTNQDVPWNEEHRQTGRTTKMCIEALDEAAKHKNVIILVCKLQDVKFVRRKLLHLYPQLFEWNSLEMVTNGIKIYSVGQSPRGISNKDTVVFVDNAITDTNMPLGEDWECFIKMTNDANTKASLRRQVSETINTSEIFTETEDDKSQISDGYHTFEELYDHRHALFIALANSHPEISWKSREHEEGGDEMYEDYFIAGMHLPTGQASYHLPLKLWDKLKVKEYKRAPKWDGHTSQDVIERILEWQMLEEE